MGLFDLFSTASMNFIELKKIDANSDMMVMNSCRFNIASVSSEFRSQVFSHIKNIYTTHPRKLTDEDYAIIKFGIYLKAFNRGDFPEQHEELRRGLNKFYARNKSTREFAFFHEVMTYIDDL